LVKIAVHSWNHPLHIAEIKSESQRWQLTNHCSINVLNTLSNTREMKWQSGNYVLQESKASSRCERYIFNCLVTSVNIATATPQSNRIFFLTGCLESFSRTGHWLRTNRRQKNGLCCWKIFGTRQRCWTICRKCSESELFI
jgi:hypothetical protein